MASTNFKLFDENKSNMLSDDDYGTNTQRLNGVQTGIASSQLQNKSMYQTSLVAYAIAQIMLQNGLDANDTDTVSTFVSNLSGALLQKVLDKATEEQAKEGTDDTKYMTPALVQAALSLTKPSIISVTLPTSSWVADGDNYKQTATIADGTTYSKVDLLADATLIGNLANYGVMSMYVSNTDGAFTAYAVAAKPTDDLTIQALKTEVLV